MKRNTELISESGTAQISLQPDREAGVIPDVQLHSDTSVNGYRYSEKAMRSIARLYEEAAIFANHGSVGVEDLLGCPRRMKVVKADGHWRIRGDAELDKAHKLYGSIMEHAELRPHLLRFSHEIPPGEAELKSVNGELVVDDVFKVGKISLIAESGGVNKGIYESDNRDTTMEITSAKQLREQYPDFVKILVDDGLKECACQQEGGSVAQAIELQTKYDKLKADFEVAQDTIAAFENEKQINERREAVLAEAEKQKRQVSDELVEMLIGLQESDDREKKIEKIIAGQPEIRENDQTGGGTKQPPRQRGTVPSAPPVSSRRNHFAGFFSNR